MPKPMKQQTIKSVLGKMKEVLLEHEVEHPVTVSFPKTMDQNLCWKWQCQIIDGEQVCGWVEVPC